MAVETKRIMNGTFGKLIFDGEVVGECYKAQAKLEYAKEEVKQCGTFFTDTKIVGCTGKGSMTLRKVNARMIKMLGNLAKDRQDIRFTLESTLEDPDSEKNEYIILLGVSFDDLTLFDWEAQKLLETEIPFTFNDYSFDVVS